MAWDVSSWFKHQAAEKAPSIVRKLHAGYVLDKTQNGRDALVAGSPIFIDGTVAPKAMLFDGADDHGAITDMFYDATSIGHGLTVEFRAAVASYDVDFSGADGTYFLSFDRNEYFRVGIGSAVNSAFKPSFNLVINSTQLDYAADSDAADGNMHLYTYRFDPATNGGQVTVFVDAQIAGQVNSLGTFWGANSGTKRFGLIGGNSEAEVFNEPPTGVGPRFRGRVEEIRLWHVARTDAEISSYSNTVSLDTTSGLQFHFIMDEITDVSERVMTWPTIRRHWSDIRTQAATVRLANNDSALNRFFRKPQAGLTTFSLEFGFDRPGLYLKHPGAMVTIPTSLNGVSSEGTVEAWFNAQDVRRTSIIYEQGGSSNGLAMHVGSENLYFGIWGVSSNQFLSTPITAGEWKHAAMTWHVGSQCVNAYLDGTLVGSAGIGGTALPAQNDPNGIGGMNETGRIVSGLTGAVGEVGSYSLWGYVADVRRWDYAREGTTIASESLVRLTGSESGLMAWYPLDQQEGATADAYGSVAPTATLIGSATWARGAETIVPFAGRLGNVSHSQGVLSIAIDDKVARLSDLAIGTNETPTTYTDSTLPSDMVWDWLTNVADFSDVQSTSNPDIDYASFQEWAGVFSGDTIVMNGNFTGQKVTEALRKMARYTQSAIYMEGGKMRFSRFTAVNTESTFVDEDDVMSSRVTVDMLELITKQTVLAGYNTSTQQWGIQTTNISSAESITYGLREAIERDENIWYTTSVSALNLAQRFTLIGGRPYEHISTSTTLKPLPRQVGETINYTDAEAGLSKGYRLMEMEFNMDNGTFELGINASQTETPFILDISELDSTDKLL